MPPASRVVSPELLDQLEPSDPRACRSRLDLRRVHRAMGSLSILKRAIGNLKLKTSPRFLLELGAGDGSLMLRLAKAMQPSWYGVSLTLLDRHHLISRETFASFAALGWEVKVLCIDVEEWAIETSCQRYDLCVTSLFLHHFTDSSLSILLRAISMKANAFVACEPARTRISKIGCALIGLLGANDVTREDAVTSVAAGFRSSELTTLWPTDNLEWQLNEFETLPFTHCLTALRHNAARGTFS